MAGDDPRLADMLDKAELRELGLRYARAIDRRDPELLRSVYHPEGIDEHGTTFSGPISDYVPWVMTALSSLEVTAHYIINTLYAVDGDKAEGELYFIAYHRSPEPASFDMIVSGRYLDRYERRDGAWKILHRRLVWDWVRQSPSPADCMQTLRAFGISGGGEGDFSYEALPMLAGLARASG
jgi:hypothetical protein